MKNLGIYTSRLASCARSLSPALTPLRRMAGICALLFLAVLPGSVFGQSNTLTSVTLAWDPSTDPGVTSYNLYYGLSSGSYATVLSTGTNTMVTVSNLTVGATYYFAVTAIDTNGLESAFSPEIAYVPTLPAAPTLQMTVSPNGQVVLIANGQSGLSYDVQGSKDLINWQVVGTATLNANGSFQITNSLGGNAFYRLRGK